jgi:LysR family transcriptional regulator, transcriptional activator of the cysJI operon
MLNLEWFRTFKAIYETGTLSAAAQVLFISQPGVSLHLNSLEAYTGHRLFERESRRMAPTDHGKMLYNFLNDPMNKLEKAEELFHRTTRHERPTISIGMCFETFRHTLEAHISELPFNLITRFGEYQQMQHELETGALDLIITTQKGQESSIEYTSFSKEQIHLICGSQTDTQQLQDLTNNNDQVKVQAWLASQTWYTTAADMGYLKDFWLQNFKSPPDFRPSYVLPFFSSILRCLSNGKGFAVVPDFLIQKDIENNQIKLAGQGWVLLENTMYFAKRKKTLYGKEIQHLEDILCQSWYKQTSRDGSLIQGFN